MGTFDWCHVLFGSAHAADWWMVCLTAVLTVAAVLAWRSSQAQLRAAHRPLLHMKAAHLGVSNETTGQFRVVIENAGTGPATSIEIYAWPRIPAANPGAVNLERRAAIEECKRTIPFNSPAYYVRAGVIAAGHEQETLMLSVRDPLEDDAVVDSKFYARGGVVIYIAFYRDTFRHYYPSRWRARRLQGKDLGHYSAVAD